MRWAANLLAVAAVAGGIGFSGAAFTANSANPSNDFSTAAVFPSVTLTDPGSALRGTITLDATTTGAIVSVTIQRSLAGAGSWTDVCNDPSSPYSCSYDTTGVPDGLYDLRATADTGTGTVYSAVVTDRRIDNTVPTVSMTDPGTPLSGTVSLGATASDTGSGVADVVIQRSPAGQGIWTDICTDSSSPYQCASFDTTSVSDALYDFRAVATDVAGNTASSTVTNRRIDNVFPTASLTDPGTPLRGTVTLDAGASDASGILNVKIQRSPAGAGGWTDICTDSTSPYSCSFDTTGVGDGLYDLRAVSTDNASHTTNSTVVTNRRVDNTVPTVSMTDPGSPLSGTITLAATANDAGSGVANVVIQRSPAGQGVWTDICTDTTSPYQCANFDTTALGDALYDFRAVATDVATNSASSTVTNRRIDNVAPTVSLTDPGANIKGTINLDATASDGGGILNVTIQRSPAGQGVWTDICTDTTSPYQCASVDTTTWGGDGLYDLRALATDNAARTNTSTVANRRVDNTAPTATMTDPGAAFGGTAFTLSATGTDGGSGVASVKIQRSPAGQGVWTDVCTDTTSPYQCVTDTTAWGGDGLYDLRSITTDSAGNSTTSATVTNRRVDNAAPTAGLTDPGSPLRLTVTLNATGTDTGGSGVLNVKIQSAPTGTSTWTDICTDTTSPYSCSWVTTGVSDGGYDLRAVTTDNAGNVTNSSTVVNRVVDNTAPTATNIQTGVTGTTAGLPQAGDTLVFTFSEQIAPATIVGGWNGTGTQTVTVTMDTGNHLSITGATLINGFVTLGGAGYVQATKTVVFSNSTISQSGASVTLTLGTPDKPQFLQTGTAGVTSWPVAAALTDLAGNAITTVTCLETTPPVDAEF
ncbi:MAG TPA: Ig-like domain-containing protein [Gaiellaceae bacterium]